MLICTNCNKEYKTGKFCTECGALLKEKPKENACPKCGTIIESPSKFCPECGAKLATEPANTADLTEKPNLLKQLYKDGKFDEAFKLAKELADIGNARGQYVLGLLYLLGKYVDSDHKQAVYWFKKAAEQNHRGAQDGLGFAISMELESLKMTLKHFRGTKRRLIKTFALPTFI